MKKYFLLTLITLFLAGGLFVIEYFRFSDGRVHLVFCDVGQGDAIFVRTPNGKHILIDGGPDRKVLNCLANNMPFWQRKIDLMILTHPHADHFMGMFYVIERYDIMQFATEKLNNKSREFEELMKMLKEREVPVQHVFSGDKWRISENEVDKQDVVLSVLGPTQDFLSKTSPSGDIGDNKEFASLILDVEYGSFHAVLTGDTQAGELGDALEGLGFNSLNVLQSPHHGSRTGLTKEIVHNIHPSLVVISVGRLNRYKHPSKHTIEILEEEKIPILRTDESGEIELVIDENGWSVQN